MLEALAAATVYATQWDKKSPFVNPMCGSGTVAIEAAMIATNRRPTHHSATSAGNKRLAVAE